MFFLLEGRSDYERRELKSLAGCVVFGEAPSRERLMEFLKEIEGVCCEDTPLADVLSESSTKFEIGKRYRTKNACLSKKIVQPSTVGSNLKIQLADDVFIYSWIDKRSTSIECCSWLEVIE
jgi:hypothetical protein